MNLPRLHLIVGFIGFLAFVLQGQYMAHGLNELVNIEDGRRMLYRSAHLYLMLTSALNLVIGIYASAVRYRAWQMLFSSVILSSPVFMLLEFFYGAQTVAEQRPYAYFSLIAVFAVISISVAIKLFSRFLKNQSDD